MPYTLGKLFVWFVLAAGLGLVIGWIAHRVFLGISSASRPREPARSSGPAESDGGGGEVDAVEDDGDGSSGSPFGNAGAGSRVVAERDRLRRELDEVRAASIAAVPRAGAEQAAAEVLRAERDRWRLLAHRHEATIGVQAATIDRMQSQLDGASGGSSAPGEQSS